MNKNTIESVWSNIAITHQDQCWLWKLSVTDRGYGQASFNGKIIRAHRLIFKLTNGYLPPVVMHTCDNPPCCNPNHLVAGTIKLNMEDMVKKGRSSRGEDHHKNKLSKLDIITIRKLCSEKISRKEIADRFGINQSYVGFIKARKTWAD